MLVRDIFWEDELILSVPVHEGMDDFQAWHYNKIGLFTVRSAYKVGVEDKKRNRNSGGGSSSTPSAESSDQCWRQLWKVNCPRKLIHFLWRLGQNSLALRMNLKGRGLKLDTKCVMCVTDWMRMGATYFSNASRFGKFGWN